MSIETVFLFIFAVAKTLSRFSFRFFHAANLQIILQLAYGDLDKTWFV